MIKLDHYSVGGVTPKRNSCLQPLRVDAQAPSLRGRYSLPRYYEPVRLPHAASAQLLIPVRRCRHLVTGTENSISTTRRGVSQVPRLFFAYALSPLTPEGSTVALAHCFTVGDRLHPIRQAGRLHWCNEAESSSLALRLARSPREAPYPALLRRTLAWLPVK